MDALYFRVSCDRQTVENQFEDLIQAAEAGGIDGCDWKAIYVAAKEGEDVAISIQAMSRRFN
jgi:DNA invertase Pin-like site-specific DNA recombinase